MSNNVRKQVVQDIADLMQGHYENPMESPDEFLYENEEGVEYIDSLLEDNHDMYHNDLLSFRQEIMLAVAKNLNVKINIQ